MFQELPIYLTTREIIKLDRQLFGENNPFSFLRGCYIHVANPLYETLARMYGAKVTTALDSCTHLVAPKGTKSNNFGNSVISPKAKIVTEDWLERCFKERKKISETEYLLS